MKTASAIGAQFLRVLHELPEGLTFAGSGAKVTVAELRFLADAHVRDVEATVIPTKSIKPHRERVTWRKTKLKPKKGSDE